MRISVRSVNRSVPYDLILPGRPLHACFYNDWRQMV